MPWLSIPCCRQLWYTPADANELTEAAVGKFYEVQREAIPEAFMEFYGQLATAGETFVTKGGCKGLQVGLVARVFGDVMICMHHCASVRHCAKTALRGLRVQAGSHTSVSLRQHDEGGSAPCKAHIPSDGLPVYLLDTPC